MKSELTALTEFTTSTLQARHVVREYLQARILDTLQQAGAMGPLAFLGGTALRFLYDIPRHSEDLDFSLEHPKADYDLRAYLHAIRQELASEGYTIDLKINDRKVVHSALVRFRGLLYELSLSPHRTQTLAIKLEVDTRPPAGAQLTTSVAHRHLTINLQHYDQASLLAGKLHAILQRSYPKGRDVYDLYWYLNNSQWPTPNLPFLNNALQQTDWRKGPLTEDNWRQMVRDRLQTFDWEAIVADVSPFLEIEDEATLLTRKSVLHLLEDRHS